MAPIRVGVIGLSTTSSFTNWAATAHFPYLQQSSKYKIIALCNSSVDKAKASIAHYKLPESTKAYGSPEDLAHDSDIDLVVNVTDVSKHYEVLLPSIKAGKNIFTELPLAQTIDQCREMAKLAKEKKIRTMFGMQGQSNPVLNTVKKIVDDGKIGQVLSTSIKGYAGAFGGKPLPTNFSRMLDVKWGANIVTVWFLHTFNNVLHVLGDLESYDSILATTQPEVGLFDAGNPEKGVQESYKVTSPDRILLHGKFKSGAVITYHVEGGDPFPGEPGLHWHIVGTKGELMITNPAFAVDIMHAGFKIKMIEYDEPKVPVHPMRHDKPVPEVIEVEIPNDSLTDLAHPAQNVGRLYESYADGNTEGYGDWDLALKRHELMHEMFQKSNY